MSINNISNKDSKLYTAKYKQQEEETGASSEIRISSYDIEKSQKNIEPSNSLFDLNDFYYKGYTSDENNEEEASVM